MENEQERIDFIDQNFDLHTVPELEATYKKQQELFNSSPSNRRITDFLSAYILYRKGEMSDSITLFIPLIEQAKKTVTIPFFITVNIVSQS